MTASALSEKPRFRSLGEGDLPELERMVLALYEENSYGESMSREKIRRTVEELARHPEKGQIVVFELGEAVVGYAILVYFWSNEYGGNIATLDEFYVKPPSRNRGIGSEFLARAARMCAASAVSLELEVSPTNDRALEFYTRQGFRPVANRHLCKPL
jgi:ribosomal protein S18 acetylase RimI-like enzyme